MCTRRTYPARISDWAVLKVATPVQCKMRRTDGSRAPSSRLPTRYSQIEDQNPEIEIILYVTEGTFDTYSWQTVERKARFIGQFMSGRLDSREIEDIGEMTLSATEVKALSSGNPLLMDKAEADAEVSRLVRLDRAHGRAQNMLKHRITQDTNRLTSLRSEIPHLEEATPSASTPAATSSACRSATAGTPSAPKPPAPSAAGSPTY
jgi:hypothetical protein